MHHPMRNCGIALLLAVLSACGGLQEQPVYNKDTTATQSISQQIDYWLDEAERAQEPQASQARLKAARLLFANGQAVRAKTVFSQVQSSGLDAGSQVDAAIVQALFARADNEPAQVLDFLSEQALGSGIDQAERAQLLDIGDLRGWALQQQGQAMDSARQRVFVFELIEDDTRRQQQSDAIWQSLSSLPQQELDAAARKESSEPMRGWLTLALIHSLYENDMFKQREQLQIWQSEWHSHAAAQMLPGDVQNLLALDAKAPERITLMLPTSGKLAAAGTAIRNGFLAAYYAAQQANGLRLDIVDTASYGSFSEAYQAALANQPDTIVGPLRKSELAALRPLLTTESPRVLALNYDESEEPSAYFQFGLAASDEAAQLAMQLSAESPQRALIIRPASAWGEKVSMAFKQQWLNSESVLLDEVSYSSADNLSGLLKEALQVDRSEQRKNRMQVLLEEALEFVPRRRQDIDLFFLVARPEEARSLKPILAFHYAGDVPVYATSQVFTGKVQRHRDRDLNGIIFTETPWMLNPDNTMRQEISNFAPAKSAYSRMHAFGADAFQLSMRLSYLSQSSTANFQGETGRLSVGGDRRIRRELELAQFVAGKPVRLIIEQQPENTF